MDFFCEVIRGYVDIYGEAAAEAWAIKKKWGKKRIAEARSCLVK
jgi:hypothetical protein